MMNLYFAELQNIRCHLTDNHFKKLAATTLRDAQKEAESKQTFEGTCLLIFDNRKEECLAYKEDDGDWIQEIY